MNAAHAVKGCAHLLLDAFHGRHVHEVCKVDFSVDQHVIPGSVPCGGYNIQLNAFCCQGILCGFQDLAVRGKVAYAFKNHLLSGSLLRICFCTGCFFRIGTGICRSILICCILRRRILGSACISISRILGICCFLCGPAVAAACQKGRGCQCGCHDKGKFLFHNFLLLTKLCIW